MKAANNTKPWKNDKGENLQRENHTTQSRTEDNFDRPPLLPRQHIEITRKGDPR